MSEAEERAKTIKAIFARLEAKFSEIEPPARLFRLRVNRDGVVALDLLIYARQIGFDVILSGEKFYIVMLGRHRSDFKFLAGLGYVQIARGRYLLGEIVPAGVTPEDLADAAYDLIIRAARKVAEPGMPAGDTQLLQCLGFDDRVSVVDVGANPLTPPPYSRLIELDICDLIGFEPQEKAFSELQEKKKPHESYFQYAVGAAGDVDLNVYVGSGFTSTYKIDEKTVGLLGDQSWVGLTRLDRVVPMKCTALDDIPGLPAFDVLKIDIQGGELNVFQNARRTMASSLCVITEVSFFPLYENAPSFADVHNELVSQGFLLHKFDFVKHLHLANGISDDENSQKSRSQIIDGDAIYLKDIRDLSARSARELKILAILGHFVFGSRDLVLRVLDELVSRGDAHQADAKAYFTSLYPQKA